VAAADVLDERVPGADHLSAAELFEAAHRSQPGLQSAVIGFDGVVNRYERFSVVGLVGPFLFRWALVGIRCDRLGQGRWE
jgi:hypothetical protein